MQTQSKAVVVLAAAIVLAALIVALSPMLWTDHYLPNQNTPVPSGCSIEVKPVVAGASAIFVAHCPAWVNYP